jgi:hypothetical protein
MYVFNSNSHNNAANYISFKEQHFSPKIFTPLRDTKPQSSVPLAETMTTSPRRQAAETYLILFFKLFNLNYA